MRGRAILPTALAAVAVTVAVGVALFPLSLALRLADASIEGRPSGRVWNGTVEDAQVRGADLGTLHLRPGLLTLLTGSLRGAVSVDGPSGQGAGVLSERGDELTIHTWEGTVSLDAFGAVGPFGRPLGGTADVRVEEARLTREGCQSGIVEVRTDALLRATQGLGAVLSAPELSGEGTCRDGTLTLPLRGAGPDGTVVAVLRLSANGYLTELTVAPNDPGAGRALAAYGFQRTPDGYSLLTRGAY